MKTKTALRALSIVALSLLGACSNLAEVKPWEKGNLAKPEMNFVGDRLESQFTEHIYVSKEAASGGTSVGSNGCGCN